MTEQQQISESFYEMKTILSDISKRLQRFEKKMDSELDSIKTEIYRLRDDIFDGVPPST